MFINDSDKNQKREPTDKQSKDKEVIPTQKKTVLVAPMPEEGRQINKSSIVPNLALGEPPDVMLVDTAPWQATEVGLTRHRHLT